MRIRYFACIILLVCNTGLINAQHFHLVKDINTVTNSNPSNYSAYGINDSFAVVKGSAFFAANDGINGVGLWKTDGTAGGTVLVKSLVPGTPYTNYVQNITPFNNGIAFAVLASTGWQLWVSDGTAAGTKKIKDLPFEDHITMPVTFSVIGGRLYFSNTNSNSRFDANELWVSDGTTAGTQMVADVYTSSNDFSYGISSLIGFKGRVYFSVYHQNGVSSAVYSIDGSATGATLTKDLTFSQIAPTLIALNDTLYFTGLELQSYTTKLWKSDGTASGTKSISGSTATQPYFGQQNIVAIKGIIYFAASNILYSYNPKNSLGLQQALAINPLNPYNLTNLLCLNDSIICFTGNDSAGRQQLWRSNGTDAGTTLLQTTLTKSTSNFEGLFACNNAIYFSCNADTLGFELWKSDGTITGTKMVKDIYKSSGSSHPSGFTAFNKDVLFSASDSISGCELWKSDGTNSGTALLKDINKTSTESSQPTLGNLPPFNVQIINTNHLLFNATDNAGNTSLWTSDGSQNGTFKIKGIPYGEFIDEINGRSIIQFKNSTYLFGERENGNLPFYKTDGTNTGTTLVQNFVDTAISGTISFSPINMAATKNLIFAQIRDYHPGPPDNILADELWVTDGISPAKLLKKYQLSIGSSGNEIPLLYPIGNTMFFGCRADVTHDGLELWKTDGTVAGTTLVKTLISGGYYDEFLGTVYKNKLYFGASDGTDAYLSVSDGTDTGTHVIKNVNVVTTQPYFNEYNYAYFTQFGGLLFFTANDGNTGRELWITDGTTAGTKLLKDINAGANSSNAGNMVIVSNNMFFTANDGIHGTELWKTDGTKAGTLLVKDITPGVDSSYLVNLVNGNGILYFTLNGILWQSDGTETGTKQVSDSGLNGVSNINGLQAGLDKIYFSGSSYAYGTELYVGDAIGTLPVQLLSFTGNLVKNDAQLAWKTTNEINNSYFNVQRSIDGAVFANVAKVNAAGNIAAINNYTFTDANVTAYNANALYYRLQQVDKNGKSTLSNIVKINIANVDGIVVSPNPAHKIAYLRSATNINNAEINVTDMAGHVLYSAKQNIQAGTQVPVNVSSFAAGTYNVTITAAGTAQKQFKLVLQ